MSLERHYLAKALHKVLEQKTDWTLEDVENLIERPRDRAMGDWAFPCFQLARVFRKAPPMISKDIKGDLEELGETMPLLKSCEAVGPYLNFKMDKSAMAANIVPEILNGSFLENRPETDRRIMIEYSQPNTHKAFHVGHMRNVALGDALSRMVRWAGNQVVAANYIGDVGAHIAKCLWYLTTQFKGSIPESNRGEFLGDMYRNAVELLDFSSLTRCPIPGVICAEVKSKKALPQKDNLHAVQLDICDAQKTVVCGGKGYEVGDLVAYAPPGVRVQGRRVQQKEVHGVNSEGMICSLKELGLSDDNDTVLVLEQNTSIGEELAEILRKPGKLDPARSVVEVMRERTDGVSQVLQKLEAKDPEITRLWEETKGWSMEAFHEIYNWLGAHFDHYFYESDVGDEGKDMVKAFFEKGVLIESEGTVGMDLSDRNLPFLMLLKSDGTGLYATKDLALARRKFEDFGIDHSVYVVDASQSLHFQQVFATLEAMGFQQASECFHLAYGLVVLPDGKMSSRGGKIILFSDLRNRLDEKIRADYLDKYIGDWSEQEIATASRAISIATIRYGMLNCDQVKNIVFDITEWTSKSGNTGPYLLYAYARIASLLEKAEEFQKTAPDWSLLQTQEEANLVDQLAEFPETVLKAAADHRPQLVCIYLYDLAKAFSRMYDRVSVLKAEDPVTRSMRLQLAEATGLTLKKGLELLGIPTLERM